MYRAEYLHNPQPPYPERSRQLGEQGQVLLRVRVSKDGRALAVAVQRSSGYRRLDRSAEEAATGWKFAPARQGGESVESELTVPVEFRLPG
nr:energy transducer TonB [Chromobacterium sp. ASV5]